MSWISVSAHGERRPPRLTVTFTLGDLPEGWPAAAHRARWWSGVIGLVLIAPFVALLAASLLHNAGFGAPYSWFSGSSIAILAGTISLFIGIPVAIAMNLWRITKVGWRTRAGAIDGLLALELAPLHLAVLVVAVVVGAAFVGHLAADSYACLNGVKSAC